jgi:hypothetical protein
MPVNWVGSPVSWTISRIDKLNHHETLLYEIDMLRFTYRRMQSAWPEATEGDLWVYLESFLVHYRNLLQFFGKRSSIKTDLTIWHPELIWTQESGLDARRPSEDDLRLMQQVGSELWKKYEDRNNRRDTISRYLQHCTTFRIAFMQWHISEMMSELHRILELFETHLPEFKPASNSDVLHKL